MTNRVAWIKQGKVVDVVMAALDHKPPKGIIAVASETADIGDTYDGTNFRKKHEPRPKEELRAYVREYCNAVIKAGIKFNLSGPGDDYKIVKIKVDNAEVIEALAWVAETHDKDVTLITKDAALKLSNEKIIELRKLVRENIAHCHELAGKLIEGIDAGHIAHFREIHEPETVTAVKLDSWHRGP
jgi:hypothetical protein